MMCTLLGASIMISNINAGQQVISRQNNSQTLDSIQSSLNYQLRNYPASQYRDVYKNFMQDFFGPGHILADTTAAGKYLRRELSETSVFDGPLYEPTGYKGNFYRVNISLIKDGIVPYDLFFDAFVKSVRGIVPPDGKSWMEIWNTIDGVIKDNDIHFEDEESDRKALDAQFQNGDYVVHHSKRYNDSVHFHYRIIARDIFENRILPLIKNHNPK